MSDTSKATMMLVGGQRLFPDGCDQEERMRFLGDLFQRLIREVANTGELTRYIGFQGKVEGRGDLQFLGIEVDRIESVPHGMISWQLDESNWFVGAAEDGHVEAPRKVGLRWDWRECSSPGPRPWVGEFSPAGRAPDLPGRMLLWCNAYVGLHVAGAADDAIRLVDYDPAWPEQFAEFSLWLRAAIGDDIALSIEHYGSTAIPGMPAKPIIDVLVNIPSFDKAKRRVLPRLNDPQWEYWWYEDHLTFIRRNRLMGERTHHVHMAPRSHRLWQGIAFRDYLCAHPADAEAYARMKRALAASHSRDRECYTREKTEFVHEITRKAMGGAA